MRRLLSVLLAVLLAGAAVYLFWNKAGSGKSRQNEQELFALLRGGVPSQARAHFERVRDDLDISAAGYAEGIVLVGEQKFEAAIPLLKQAVSDRPDESVALDFLIAALLGTGQSTDALAQAEAYVKTHPDDALGLWILASTLYFSSDPEGRDPQRVLQLLERFDLRATALRAEGKSEQDIGPKVAQVARLRAMAASELGKHDQARKAAKVVVDAQRDDWQAWALLAEVARTAVLDPTSGKQDWITLAAGAYSEAIQRAQPAGVDTFALRMNLAQLMLNIPKAGKPCLAIARELVNSPYGQRTDVQILYARALVRSNDAGQMDEAFGIYERLLKAEPENLTVLRNFGVLIYDWKEGGQRGAYLERAFELLTRYNNLGGTIDETLRDAWETLVRYAQGDAAAVQAANGFALLHRAEQSDTSPTELLTQAVAWFEKAIKGDPQRPRYVIGLVKCMSGLVPERAADMETWSRLGLERFPQEPDIQSMRAEAILSRQTTGDPTNAQKEAALRDLLDLSNTYPENAYVRAYRPLSVFWCGGTPRREALEKAVPALREVGPELWAHIVELEKQK